MLDEGIDVSSDHSISWIGKIALIYPSDNYYTYSLGVDNICYTDSYNCPDSSGKNNGWIYTVSNRSYLWLLSPNNDVNVWYLHANGRLGLSGRGTSDKNAVRPTLYLSSQVKIASGDGSEQNPYRLKL